MSDRLVLRAATPADAASLAATIAAAFAQYRGKLDPESGAFRETADGIAAELATDAGAIVAERNGEMVGCVVLRILEGDLYLGRLSVLPAARGLGIARQLVAAVEDEARRRELAGVRLGVRIVLTENQKLLRLARLPRNLARGPSRLRPPDLDQHAQGLALDAGRRHYSAMTTRTPLTGPAVWLGQDIKTSQRWIRDIPPDAIDELDAALKAVKGMPW